jgi:hypothetical protein
MVEQAATEKKSHVGAALGWGLLAVATIGFIWFISTQLSVGYEGREDEALQMVKSLQLPGMKHTLSDSTIEIGNEARASGSFIGQFSWSASQVQGPMYLVKLTWMEGSEHRRAEWSVDLEKKKIEAAGPSAADFLKRAGATETST